MIGPPAVTEVLLQRPEVVEAVVVKVLVDGRPRTVAVAAVDDYVGAPILREELHRALGNGAPDGVVVLDGIPRSGAEPDLDAISAAAAEQGPRLLFQAPADDAERQIAAIWSAALDLDRVGVHDDFLDLGGDSIAAIRILTDVEREFGIELAPYDLLDGTIRTIAEAVRDR